MAQKIKEILIDCKGDEKFVVSKGQSVVFGIALILVSAYVALMPLFG
jgi:hypothetical protein